LKSCQNYGSVANDAANEYVKLQPLPGNIRWPHNSLQSHWSVAATDHSFSLRGGRDGELAALAALAALYVV